MLQYFQCIFFTINNKPQMVLKPGTFRNILRLEPYIFLQYIAVPIFPDIQLPRNYSFQFPDIKYFLIFNLRLLWVFFFLFELFGTCINVWNAWRNPGLRWAYILDGLIVIILSFPLRFFFLLFRKLYLWPWDIRNR